jgi:hypothetical protein
VNLQLKDIATTDVLEAIDKNSTIRDA